eukprot:2820836-Amphidinium_carterae.3
MVTWTTRLLICKCVLWDGSAEPEPGVRDLGDTGRRLAGPAVGAVVGTGTRAAGAAALSLPDIRMLVRTWTRATVAVKQARTKMYAMHEQPCAHPCKREQA